VDVEKKWKISCWNSSGWETYNFQLSCIRSSRCIFEFFCKSAS